MGLLKTPQARLVGVGKGALDVAEKLVFEQVGRNPAAVHRHQRAVAAAAERVDRPRRALLARAGLAGDQYRGVFGGDQTHLLEHLEDGFTAADQQFFGRRQTAQKLALQSFGGKGFSDGQRRFAGRLARDGLLAQLERQPEAPQQLFDGKWLAQIVAGAVAQQLRRQPETVGVGEQHQRHRLRHVFGGLD